MCLNQFPHSYFSICILCLFFSQCISGAFPLFIIYAKQTQSFNWNWIKFLRVFGFFPISTFSRSIQTRSRPGWQRASVSFNWFHVHYVPQTIKNDFTFAPLSLFLCIVRPFARLLAPKCTIKLMQSHFRHKNDSSWQIIGLALALFQFISLRYFDLFFVCAFHSSLLSCVFQFILYIFCSL